jgi:hypothetical protein
MNEIVGVFLSWQFLLAGLAVFFIMWLSTQLGARLWSIKRLRTALKILTTWKVFFPPIIGGAMGVIPGIPVPEAVASSTMTARVMLMAVAGLCCQVIFKGVKHALESRGIDVTIDDPPKKQKA